MTEHHEEHCKHGEHHHCCEKSHHKHHEGHCEWQDELLKVADEAWMELLKEKIKENIQKENGAHVEKLAELVSKANADRWKHKMKAKNCYEGYQESLKDFYKSKE